MMIQIDGTEARSKIFGVASSENVCCCFFFEAGGPRRMQNFQDVGGQKPQTSMMANLRNTQYNHLGNISLGSQLKIPANVTLKIFLGPKRLFLTFQANFEVGYWSRSHYRFDPKTCPSNFRPQGVQLDPKILQQKKILFIQGTKNQPRNGSYKKFSA